MNNKKLILLLLGWLSILLLISCQPVSEVQTTQPAKAQDSPVPSTIEPKTAPTPFFTATVEIDNRDIQNELRDLLIGVSANPSQFCDMPERNQIWLLSSHADAETVLLADEEIDFNYPQWMPDGERFLYVESIPVLFSEAEEGHQGMDSIWIAEADGSNRERLSDYYPRINHWTPSNRVCLRDTFITGPLVISPDGKYVAFVHRTENPETYFYKYYVLNIGTRDTILLHTMQDFSIPVWYQGSSHLIIIDDKDSLVRVFDLDSTTAINSRQFDYPPEVLEPNEGYTVRYADGSDLFYSVAVDGSNLIGSFSAIYSLHSYFEALWILDLESGDWYKEDVQFDNIWRSPLLGDTISVACSIEGIYFLDLSDWSLKGTYPLENRPWMRCRDLVITESRGGEEAISFVTANEGADGIWIIKDITKAEMAQMYINIGSDQHNYERIWYYSWQP